MGRHSIEQKRVKRKNQKRSKRKAQQRIIESGDSTVTEDEMSTCTSDLELNGEEFVTARAHEPPVTGNSSDGTVATLVRNLNTSDEHACDGELFSALDRINEDSDEYWDKLAKDKIREFDSYHDAHPCIVENEQRSIRVYVDGSGPYKGTAGLKRVTMEDYIGRLMKKEAKATELCRAMRDRIETLEDSLRDSKVKMIKMHRESQRRIEKVRYFWRNKIYEGNSRGGELLKAALIYPDMYS